MSDIDSLTDKLRNLPEPLLHEVEDFIDFLQTKRSIPAGTPIGTHPVMAAFGLWRDAEDLDQLTEQIYANRKAQSARSDIEL